MSWKASIARLLAPEEFAELERKKSNLDMAVNQRVADAIFKMDPFEPLLKKYNIVFPKDAEDPKPEDNLDSMASMRLYMWAYGMKSDPNFIHLTDWLRNKQGNATLRKGKQNDEWFYGRASIATITLFIDEIGRLSSRYEEVMAGRNSNSFDANLPVGEY